MLCVGSWGGNYRHSGDEFCVVAPETDRDEVEGLAARLRQGVREVKVDGRRLGACTGCAVYPDDGEDLDALLARADERLRVSKEEKPRTEPLRLLSAFS